VNAFAIVLVLTSTFLHAGWNLLARRSGCEAAFFRRMLLVMVVAGFVPVAVSELMVRSLTPKAWACVFGSGFCCGLYYFFLMLAYGSSDFTAAYPVARGLPVFLLGVGDLVRGAAPAPAGWAGMLLVGGGCVLAPQESIRGLSMRRYLARSSLWLVLTASATVGYTLLDKIASEAVMGGPATAARYCYVFFTVSFVVYCAMLRIFGRRLQGQGGGSIGWGWPVVAGVLNFGAYWLVLWAYQLTARASYVFAFRQFGIVAAVVMGVVLLREKGLAVRFTAAVMISAGLVLIGLAG